MNDSNGKGHGQKLSRMQEGAIGALLMTSTIGSAAEKCGISVSTLLRWQRLPAFAEKFNEAKTAALDQTINELRGIGSDAVKRLGEIVRDRNCPPSVAVHASVKILELLLRAQAADSEARLIALEAKLTEEEPA